MKPILLLQVVLLSAGVLAPACDRDADSLPAAGPVAADMPVLQTQASRPGEGCLAWASSSGADEHPAESPPTPSDSQLQLVPHRDATETVSGASIPKAGDKYYEGQTHSAPASAPMGGAEALQRFRANTDGLRMDAARIVKPLVKVGMTQHEVVELLGRPNREPSNGSVWHYDVFWSHAITIEFDGKGKVTHVRSTFENAPAPRPTGYAFSPPKDLADALRQFREERPRVAAARMIEPLLKIGMDQKEVEDLLGPPTKDRNTLWIYGLGKDEALSDYWVLFFKDSKLVAVDSSTSRPKPTTRPQAGEPAPNGQ